MRFEAKHSYFKQVHHATHNHVNLLKSMAVRHQNLQLYHLLSPEYFLDIEFGSRQLIDIHTKDFIQIRFNLDSNKYYL